MRVHGAVGGLEENRKKWKMSADRWLVPEPTGSIPPATDGPLAGRRTEDRKSARKPYRIKKRRGVEAVPLGPIGRPLAPHARTPAVYPLAGGPTTQRGDDGPSGQVIRKSAEGDRLRRWSGTGRQTLGSFASVRNSLGGVMIADATERFPFFFREEATS